MAIIPLNEITGSSGNDSLLGNYDRVYYGLKGNDYFQAQPNQDWIFFIGGKGNDTYVVADHSAITILEAGNSSGDKLVSRGIGLSRTSSIAITIDGRHLMIADSISGQQVTILDWKQATHKIETVELADGIYSYSHLVSILSQANIPNYSLDDIADTGIIGHYGSSDAYNTYAYLAQRATYLEATTPVFLNGSGNNDILRGTSDMEVLDGGAGNDWLEGGAGADMLIGGAGNAGNDSIDAGVGNDTMTGGAGTDRYIQTDAFGHDVIYGDNQDTIVFTAAGLTPNKLKLQQTGNDLLMGTADDSGNDVRIMGWYKTAARKVGYVEVGGLSYVLNVGSDKRESINGGTGNELIYGLGGNDVMNGNGGNDILYGDDGNDTINGGLGNDIIYAGTGNDVIVYDANDVWGDGGNGLDILDASRLTKAIVYDLNGSSATFSGFEGIWSGLGNDVLTGTADDNIFRGNGGNDWIDGRVGNDTLEGGNGADTLIGNAGDDYLLGGDGKDTLIGGMGYDTLAGGAGADVYIFDTGFGQDVIVKDRYNSGDVIQLNNVADDGTSQVCFEFDRSDSGHNLLLTFENGNQITVQDWFSGSSYKIPRIMIEGVTYTIRQGIKDTENVNASKNIRAGKNELVIGFGGDDTIQGGSGNDVFYGGDGQDIYVINKTDSGNRVILGSQNNANDKVLFKGYKHNDVTISVDDGHDGLILSFIDSKNETRMLSLSDWLRGGDYQLKKFQFDDGSNFYIFDNEWRENVLYGTNNDDAIDGSGDDDIICGLGGNDNLYGGLVGADVLYGGDGNDTLYGNSNGNDSLYGEADNDLILFGSTNSYVDGGAGADSISGVVWGGWSSLDSCYTVTLHGGSGDDTINNGNVANSLIFGDAGNDNLSSGNYNDTLFGGDGNDTLSDGGGYKNLLNGGTGNDVYQLLLRSSNQDTIDSFAGMGSDHGHDEVDILCSPFGIAYTPNDFVYARIDNDLVMTSFPLNSSINFVNWFMGNDYQVDLIKFADTLDGGTSLTANQLCDLALVLRNPTEDQDLVYGTGDGDIFDGLGGDDRIYGLDGNDSLSGGYGNDVLVDGLGNDTLNGGLGDDILYVDSDSSYGITEANLLYGGDGDDTLDGSAVGNDSLYGEAGNDVITLVSGNSYVDGGAGADKISTISSLSLLGGEMLDNHYDYTVTLHGGDDDDVISQGSSNSVMFGDAGNDSLIGTGGKNNMYGGYGNDTLHDFNSSDCVFINGKWVPMGNGNDTLHTDNLLNGGAGNDIYQIVMGYCGQFNIDNFASTGSDPDYDELDFLTSYGSGYTSNDFTYSSLGNDLVMTNTALNCSINFVNWFLGNDYQVDLVKFIDTLGGSASLTADELSDLTVVLRNPTNGRDLVYGTNNDDIIDGLGGDDIIYGLNGNDSLVGNLENDTLIGGPGSDTLYGAQGEDLLYAWNDTSSYLGGYDSVAGDNVLYGGSGDDTLFGSKNGNDSLCGEDGDDIIVFGSGANCVDGGAGADSINSAEINCIFGFATTLHGGDDDDVIRDSSTVYTLMFGDAGNDSLSGGSNMNGGDGDDIISNPGGVNNVMCGDAGNDSLVGGCSNDTLWGGDGNDTLSEIWHGCSLLNGGTGNDVYRLSIGSWSQYTIDNFAGAGNDHGYDEVEIVFAPQVGSGGLHGLDFTYSQLGDDLVMTHSYSPSQIRFTNWFQGDDHQVDIVTLVDSSGGSTVWTADQLTSLVPILRSPTNGADLVYGTNNDDSIDGLGGEDRIYGLVGNDLIIGNLGNDVLVGGRGNDTLYGDQGDDLLYAWNDTSSYYGSYDTTEGANVLHGGTGNDTLYGSNSGNDSLYGEIGNDIIIFISNTSYVDGGEGADTINGTFCTVVHGGDGDDMINTWTGQLFGDAGNDSLVGNDANNNILYGGDGNDTLYDSGGSGNLLSGGAGSDVYQVRIGSYIINNLAGMAVNDSNDELDILPCYGTAYTPGDFAYSLFGNDLIMTNSAHKLSIDFANWFGGSDYQVDYIKFVDTSGGGQVMTAAQFTALVIPT